MAGIGFELRVLSRRHSIAGPLVSLGHATWVSSGPLVLTAVGLLAIHLLTFNRALASEFTLFTVMLTYASILALITASPIAVLVTRLVADCMYEGRHADIPPLFVGALACAALAAAMVGTLIWGVLLVLPANVAISAWALSQSVALLWVAVIFLGTLKDYAGVTGAFLAGVLVSVSTALVLRRFGLDVAGMMWSMTAGNMTTSLWLAARILFAFPGLTVDPLSGLQRIYRGLWRFPLLAVGAATGALGVWIDKWVMWSSSLGQTVSAGLVYAPIYDSAMFASFLIIVPALAAFIVHVETDLYTRLRRFLSRVLNHGTLDEIEKEAESLGTTVRAFMFHLFVVQAAITACAILALPLIVQTLGMPFRQIPVMRLGLLGSVFHLLFLLCCSVLLFINRQAAYCALQILFLALNGLLTWIFVQFGPDLSGMGYFTAAMICGVIAYFWLDRTLRDLVFLTFASARSIPSRDLDPTTAWRTPPMLPTSHERASSTAAVLVFATLVYLIAHGTADAQSQQQRSFCERPSSGQSAKFSGLYPAIEERMALSNFAAGQVVEIDPRAMPIEEARAYVGGLQSLGARVSIYLVGGHCDRGADCDELPKEVRLGTTGSWNWDESERRILDITHPAVLARLAKGIENGWQLGANYIRIDNLHHPAGSTHPRTPAQMKAIIDLGHDIEDRLRADGTIEPKRVTGLVAHNNLVSWASLIEQGNLRRLPAILTSERTAQLAALPAYEGDARMMAGRLDPLDIPDIQAGRRVAEHFRIPYSIVEFRKSHDLARRGRSYELPAAYVEAARKLAGVTEVIVIKDESRYVGRDEVFAGPGPATLPQEPGLSPSLSTAKACALMRLPDE